MSRQSSVLAARGRGLLALALALLPACAPLGPPPPAFASPQPTVAPVRFTHAVRFPPDRAEPTAAEAAGLRAFVASLPLDRRVAARVVGHRGGGATGTRDADLAARRAERVAELVRGDGLADVEIAVAPVGETAPVDPTWEGAAWTRGGGVSVTAMSLEVILPGCPDWSRDPGFDPRNLPLSNLGCANAYNLGLMVADPADLAPRRELAPADGTREAEAVLRYRTDKVKQLEADIIQ
ncbi:MAG TPA: CpaD family pilus assembly lipoprotein [Geminicoccaceae bacterium]|nr:CpaD family pilus assembly lipoprotein [Geminicoccaceae bacterium]